VCIEPSFLLIRNLGFVVDLAVAAILFHKASKIIDEIES